MTEVTRVPLQPIRSGSLTKLWLGIALAVLLAAGLAWAAAPEYDLLDGGVRIVTLEEGEGDSPTATDIALIDYMGTLPDGTVFDQNQGVPMEVSGVVPGFATALQHMQPGGRYRIVIPADQAYGAQGSGPIPPDTDLTFEVRLLEFRSREEIMQMMRQQQMMQQLQQQGAVPGMPPGMVPGAVPGAVPGMGQ
ncbi:FKBP-type peptidyl-prolyl cis-trans isomerase [Altericroceibacterium xinjiangense]|uniref:FKBP-type peptidyl-prolyl cis-trans isomerase n=1 Tax=Altericroceibacterium xinjiangense TaxID=762261 RepID=UPI000F7ECD50|nr:FKBP-type peptidyl-prolyl cis-trans isomerase [Altericroceibacterium xinjiangense]